MKRSVSALFGDPYKAHAAAEELVQNGFRREDVSILMSGTHHGREFRIFTRTRATSWGGLGGAIGLAAGALGMAWVVRESGGWLTLAAARVPALESHLAALQASVEIAALAGAGALGLLGGLLGFLLGAFRPEYEVRPLRSELENGNALLTLAVPARHADRARTLLQRWGASRVRTL